MYVSGLNPVRYVAFCTPKCLLKITCIVCTGILPGLCYLYFCPEASARPLTPDRITRYTQELTDNIFYAQEGSINELPQINLSDVDYLYNLGRQFYSTVTSQQVNDCLVSRFQSDGARPYSEDRLLAATIQIKQVNAEVFAVFDGHSGSVAVEFIQRYFVAVLTEQLCERATLSDPDIYKALKETNKELNRRLYNHLGGNPGGTTASVALKINDLLYVSNVGDSRTILLNGDKTFIQCSEDANLMTEKTTTAQNPTMSRLGREAMLRAAMGGFSREQTIGQDDNGHWRLRNKKGELFVNMTSGFGDFECVPFITSKPKISGPYPIEPGSRLLMGSDGLFDGLTSCQCNQIANSEGVSVEQILWTLGCVAMGVFGAEHADNTSIQLVEFSNHSVQLPIS